MWWCIDISLAVYRRAVRERTDLQFVCPECKLQPPSLNVSFNIADVSFDRTGGVEDECLSDGHDDGVDNDIPLPASQLLLPLRPGSLAKDSGVRSSDCVHRKKENTFVLTVRTWNFNIIVIFQGLHLLHNIFCLCRTTIIVICHNSNSRS